MSKVKLLLKEYRNLLILVPVRDGNWVAKGRGWENSFSLCIFFAFY